MAPMAEVTIPSFRRMVVKLGKPDVIFTEFIACDGIASKEGKAKLLSKLKFSGKERPIVAQFFGAKPENFTIAAKLAVKLGFDGIDINMGCPSKRIGKQGAGASLILNPKLAKEVILATKKGAGKLPVSVKTRLGYEKNSVENWMNEILEAEPAAITIHGRSKKEGRKSEADWESIRKAKEIIKAKNPKIIVIGNGDVKTKEEAVERSKTYGLDGAMIGRAVMTNPWFFAKISDPEKISLKKRAAAAKTQLKLFQKEVPGRFNPAKKFLKSYFAEFENAREIRNRLLNAKTYEQAFKVLDDFLKKKTRLSSGVTQKW